MKVQFDVTKKDSEEIKMWYEDARMMGETYNIDSYPTYFFFNPKGELVHRVNGATKSGDDFIARAEIGLSDYYKQKKKFEAGMSDPESLLQLIKSAQLINDRELIPVVTNAYLATQKDLLTEENLKLIATSTKKPTGPGFTVLKKHADKADLILGTGVSRSIVKAVILNEIVLTYLRVDAVRKDFGGGMYAYTGEINKHVDWKDIQKKLDLEYPELTDEILMGPIPMYYKWAKNWPEFAIAVSSFRDKMDKRQLNAYANDVFLFYDDPQGLEAAIGWSKHLLASEQKKNISYLSTYADLLYKTGKKEEAIKTMEEVVALSGVKESHLTETLDKMKAGK